jgi:peptide/nickel transport system substrate-binding protein
MRTQILAVATACSLGVLAAAEPVLAARSDDTLDWATTREVAVIDPYYNNTRELVIMGQMAWDGLVLRNIETGEYEPLLATDWEWNNNTTIDFTLRKGVTFHDGSKFDADDVVYTMNFVSNKDSGVLTYQLVSWIEKAEKLGPYKVRLHLNKPFPPALAYLSNGVPIMPEGHYDDVPKKADGSPDYGAAEPVGTGPYEVTDVKAGEYVMMEAYDDYFGEPKGPVGIDKIRFRTISDMNTQMAELMTGSLDWIWDVPKEQAERLQNRSGVTVTNAKTMRVSYLAFDVNGDSTTDVFTNKKVRKAVAHAIDRESIAKNLVGPASEVIHAPCHPAQFGCVEEGLPRWEHDPEKARQLLKEAGYPDGFEFDIYAYRQRQYTEAVIGDLKEVGIDANLNFMQYRALRSLVHKGKTPINHMTWGSNSIPDASAIVGHFFSGGPDDPAKDPNVIELVRNGNTSIDPELRREAYKKAYDIIAGDLYWLPMFTYAKYYAYSDQLDFTPTSDEIPRFYNASWK